MQLPSIIINGKNWIIDPTVEELQVFKDKYDPKESKDWTNDQYMSMFKEMIFTLVAKKRGLRPFVTYSRFCRKLKQRDFDSAIPVFMSVLYGMKLSAPTGEDKETKN